MVFPSSSEMTSLYIGRNDPTLPRFQGLDSNYDGTERGKGVNVQLGTSTTHGGPHAAMIARMHLPISNVERQPWKRFLELQRTRLLRVLCSSFLLAACGPPSWQGGIHAVLAWSHAGVRVVEVPADGPALRAGLRPGDRIVAIDGNPVADRDAQEVRSLLSGEVGSRVTIEVLRDGRPLTLSIEREPYTRREK
jgi:membrane-associated protease RseP (regulator of RpoE activity)